MKITIRVEITTDWDETDTFEICQLERPYRQLEPEKVGLSLAEGKDLLHRLQKVVVAAQAEEVCMLRRFCTRCHRSLELKAGYCGAAHHSCKSHIRKRSTETVGHHRWRKWPTVKSLVDCRFLLHLSWTGSIYQ